MATEVILPKVDMDMATGKISRWLVDDGAVVEKGAALFEIETDKAAMEVDAPASGILRITEADTGKDIAVGEPVAWIHAKGEAIPDPPARDAVPANAVAGAPVMTESAPSAQPGAVTAQPGALGDGLRATPLARRLARANGLALADIAGTGPRGRIQRIDIEACLQKRPVTGKPIAAVSPAETAEVAPMPAPRPAATSPADGLHAVWLREGRGTPIVLVHGFGAELASWRPLLSEIATDRSVFAVDLPGHGKSIGCAASSFDDLVAQVERALAENGIGAAHLVGHSLGAAVAAAVASGIRVEAASLLLISPAGLGPDISSFPENFARSTQPAAVAGWLRELVHDQTKLGDGFIRTVARDREDGRLAAAQTRLAAAIFGGGAQGFSIRAALTGLGCPVRIVFGLEDKVIPWRHTLGLPGMIGLHLFQQTGHMPQLEQREAVGRILAQMQG